MPNRSERLSIGEMARILDVAAEVRRSQDLIEGQFRREEQRDMLRERLRGAAGQDELSEEQLDAAIEWYYDNLHRYKRPEPSLQLWLARLYIRRGWLLLLLLPLLAAALLAWLLLR